MESPVVRIMLIAAAVAAAAAVVAIMWTMLNTNAPDTGPGQIDYGRITTEQLCEAVDGTWTAASKSCAAQTTTTTLAPDNGGN